VSPPASSGVLQAPSGSYHQPTTERSTMSVTSTHNLPANRFARDTTAPTHDFEVCGTCSNYIANADDSSLDLYDDADEIRERRDQELNKFHEFGYHWIVADVEGRGHLWQQCDVCDTDPGFRYIVKAVK